MRSFRALISASTILLLTSTALKARADDPYTFTLSATAPNSGSLTFSLSPDTPYMLPTSFGDFDYYNPPGFIGGAPTSFDAIDVTPYQGGESLFVGDDFFDFYALFDFSQQFLIGTPDGSQPVIVPGTYSGEVGCDVALRSPLATSQLPVTMALLQFQTPFTTECGEAFDLTITGQGTTPPPSSVTPEPESLGLFGSGVLGLAGLLRRRNRA